MSAMAVSIVESYSEWQTRLFSEVWPAPAVSIVESNRLVGVPPDFTCMWYQLPHSVQFAILMLMTSDMMLGELSAPVSSGQEQEDNQKRLDETFHGTTGLAKRPRVEWGLATGQYHCTLAEGNATSSEGSSYYDIGSLPSCSECFTAKMDSSCPDRMSFANQRLADQEGVGARGVVVCAEPAASGYDCREPRGGRRVPERRSNLKAKRSSLGCGNLSRASPIGIGIFLSTLQGALATETTGTGGGGVPEFVTDQLANEGCYPAGGFYGMLAWLFGSAVCFRVGSWVLDTYGEHLLRLVGERFRRAWCPQEGDQAAQAGNQPAARNDMGQEDGWEVHTTIRRRLL